ncbi:DUF3048 domain-containing protein [Nocardioides sp.]|uniref:DUF3048 domain-containing protein n=1 Tax=Nocardioides sp. TaxID=35761 RepID=UPI00286CC78E|nr:DUF3048 domain-containing protein [Nocardioides sp.]
MRSTRLLATVLVTGSLVLAACGGDEKSPASDTPEAQASAAAAEVPQTWPLTGLEVADGKKAEQKHPVLVLKMDNTPSSAPQVGLGEADLVVEELVEGGVTRLAAFYYSQVPGDVGPVRSMRASDIGIVSPVGAAMVTSGAAPVTINRIKDAGITFFAEGAKGFYRESSRSAPYNLFTNLADTASLIEQGAERPQDYLPWGDPQDLPSGQPATEISASFSGGHTTTWSFRDGGYVNDNSFAAEGDRFPADTVLALRVEVGDAGYTDPAGNPVPETIFEGKGDAMLFHDGRLVRGTWSKSSLKAPIELSTHAGPLTVPAGRVWIELVPRDGGDVTFAR